eukprot:m.246519 g.246519  ORF g.246519 m.246519 type:complete len:577 (-) comp16117_c0_seq9:3214-4944(-)
MSKTASRAKVAFPYVAERQDELTLNPGDIFLIKKEETDGWVQGLAGNGVSKGQFGWFPKLYLDYLPNDANITQLPDSASGVWNPFGEQASQPQSSPTASANSATPFNPFDDDDDVDDAEVAVPKRADAVPRSSSHEKDPLKGYLERHGNDSKRRMTAPSGSGNLKMAAAKARQEPRRASVQTKPLTKAPHTPSRKVAASVQRTHSDSPSDMNQPMKTGTGYSVVSKLVYTYLRSIRYSKREEHQNRENKKPADVVPNLPPRNPSQPMTPLRSAEPTAYATPVSSGSGGKSFDPNTIGTLLNADAYGSALYVTSLLHKKHDKSPGKLRHVFFFEKAITVCKPGKKGGYTIKAKEDLHSLLEIGPHPWRAHKKDEKPLANENAGFAIFQRLILPAGEKRVTLDMFGVPGKDFKVQMQKIIMTVNKRLEELRMSSMKYRPQQPPLSMQPSPSQSLAVQQTTQTKKMSDGSKDAYHDVTFFNASPQRGNANSLGTADGGYKDPQLHQSASVKRSNRPVSYAEPLSLDEIGMRDQDRARQLFTLMNGPGGGGDIGTDVDSFQGQQLRFTSGGDGPNLESGA